MSMILEFSQMIHYKHSVYCTLSLVPLKVITHNFIMEIMPEKKINVDNSEMFRPSN